jgi:hypothetical protein
VKQGQKFTFKIITKAMTKADQRGQAVVEYILMLVVVVSLVLGAKKAFSSLDKFFKSYVGDYVACLMEYGELPSLGSTNTDLNVHSPKGGSGKLCDAKFEDFSFTGGFAATGGSGGGGGGSGSGGSNGGKNGNGSANSANGSQSGNKNSSSNASNSSNEDGDNGDGADGVGGGSSGRRGRRGGSARNNPYQNGQISKSDSFGSADGGSGGDGKTRYIEDDSEDSARRRGRSAAMRRFYRVEYTHSKYKAITGVQKEELEKNMPKKPRQPEARVVKVDDGGSRIGPVKRAFIPPERKPAAEDTSQDSGLTFGNFFKWLVIGGIIIACLVFFGGQLLNYSNSQDG